MRTSPDSRAERSRRAPRPTDDDVKAAINFELDVHTTVLLGLVGPVAGFVLPLFVMVLGIVVGAHAVAELAPGAASIAKGIDASPIAGFGLALLGCATLATIGAVRARALARPRRDRKLKLLDGPPGTALASTAEALWDALGQSSKPLPRLSWFPNFNLAASAARTRSGDELQLSAATVDDLLRGGALGKAIMAHELAHLVHRDTLRLNLVHTLVGAAAMVLEGLLAITLLVALLLMATSLQKGLQHGGVTLELVSAAPAILFGCGLVAGGLWLLRLATLRYGALVVALVELRADVSGALAVGGFQKFSATLADDSRIRASNWADVAHSLVSARLTHLSNLERRHLLQSPARLVGPKLGYFGLSAALAFLLPLNPVTPLVFGGALDHAMVTAVFATLVACCVSSLLNGAVPSRAPPDLGRLGLFAVAVVVCGALPLINLYAVGYLLTNTTVRLAGTGGFGGDDNGFNDLLRDVDITAKDLVGKAFEATGGWQLLLAIALNAGAFAAIARLSGLSPPLAPWARRLVIAVGTVLAMLVSFDPWRDGFYALDPLALGERLADRLAGAQALRLSAPALVAALAVALIVLANRMADRLRRPPSPAQVGS